MVREKLVLKQVDVYAKGSFLILGLCSAVSSHL